MSDAVYLDHNATSPLRPEAASAMAEAFELVGNPSSVHGFGRRARGAVEDARACIAGLLGVGPAEIVFTGGGTEANNLALRGSEGRRLLISAVEHDSVLNAVPEPQIVPVDGDGVIDLAALEEMLAADPEPALVSVMMANNETGVVQPLAAVAETARRFAALVHCDAVQAVGKIPLSMDGLGVDMLSLTAHKLGGPPGVGALVVREGLPVAAQVRGGGQEKGRRAGTENVAGIAGFAAAAEAAIKGLEDFAGLGRLRDGLEERIAGASPKTRFLGAAVERLPNTSCMVTPGMDGGTRVMALDLEGVAVSAGSACSSGRVHASHVLEAMALPDDQAMGAIRASLGWNSKAGDVDRFVDAWRHLDTGAMERELSAPAA